MTAVSVINKISDFLSKFAPFSFLSGADVYTLASAVEVHYFDKEEYIFQHKSPSLHKMFVLKKGVVKLFLHKKEEKELIDICDIGQSFGLRAAFSSNDYILDAVVENEALVYSIPIDVIKELMEQNPKMALFYAEGFASGSPIIKLNDKEENRNRKTRHDLLLNKTDLKKNAYLQDLVVVKPNKKVVSVSEDITIWEAAKIMTTQKVGSVLVVDKDDFPIGIVTGNDFVKKVVSESMPYENSVAEIMSKPVHTISANQNVALNLMEMTKNNIRHLVITEDGSPKSRVIGVISERDLMLYLGKQPATIVKRMQKVSTKLGAKILREKADSLIRNYLEQDLATPFICEVVSSINDMLIRRIIELSLDEMKEMGEPIDVNSFCWVTLGSEGRKEQLLKTDQDNAIIFKDVDEDERHEVRKSLLKLADLINRGLNLVGFEMCPAEIMGRNPSWCLTVSEWKNRFSNWTSKINEVSMVHSTIFFDMRYVWGNESLHNEVRDFSFSSVNNNTLFIPFLAKNALENPPPLSFFSNLVLESNGVHKDMFDLKKRAIRPLIDGARVLALFYNIHSVYTTLERFEELKKCIPEESHLFDDCMHAFETVLRYRALSGFKYKDSGRYIRPANLENMEKQILKFVFKTISELQSLLKVKFKLVLLS